MHEPFVCFKLLLITASIVLGRVANAAVIFSINIASVLMRLLIYLMLLITKLANIYFRVFERMLGFRKVLVNLGKVTRKWSLGGLYIKHFVKSLQNNFRKDRLSSFFGTLQTFKSIASLFIVICIHCFNYLFIMLNT
jgi:hypothetical protein